MKRKFIVCGDCGLDEHCGERCPENSPRHFVSMYTDGPSTRWNVIDRQTQEWIRRFPTEAEAQAHADKLNAS